MEERAALLLKEWERRNIRGYFCPDKNTAAEKVLELIPGSASIGISGSKTLDQIEIVGKLEQRGNRVLNQYRAGLNQEESADLRRCSIQADYYLASANAVSQKGELVFFSAYGNRTAGIAYAKNVVIVCGMNKIAPDLGQALKRARNVAVPLNTKRLKWNTPCCASGICREDECSAPEFKRMCCQVLVVEAEAIPGRLSVILVREDLGF